MRVIEKKMLNAIDQGKDFKLHNTQVTITFNKAHVFLHDNHIASVVDGKTIVNLDTLRAYPTPTTKSRLRALGVDVYTKNFVTYMNGEAI